MRVLLLQHAPYVPARGGANKSNLLLLEELACASHPCAAVALASSGSVACAAEQLNCELRSREVTPLRADDDHCVFRLRGVEVWAVLRSGALRVCVHLAIREFAPDWILVSSEDPGQALLRQAMKACPDRVAYLAHTALALPFGPGCFAPSETGTALVRSAAAILTPSEFMCRYIRESAGFDSRRLPIAPLEAGPYPNLANFDEGYVTIVNPCAVKGISVFIELAQQLPRVQFAAVPAWGTTSSNLDALRSLSNVRILAGNDDITVVFRQTRVLVVPSLWIEAWGRIVIEAMLHGIPVIASDSGGLPEAKLGVDYLVPVRTISQFSNDVDENRFPEPVVPDQRIEPWVGALRAITEDREEYERISRQSREASREFATGHRATAVADFLKASALLSASGKSLPENVTGHVNAVERLSPYKRALLAKRLAAMDTATGNGRQPECRATDLEELQ